MVAEAHALDVSTCGSVKLTLLCGALFNHKDNKKGQQDNYDYYFALVLGQCSIIFPDTSNTWYQSNCATVGELLVNCSHYQEFLVIIHDKKEKPVFNHMEQMHFMTSQHSPNWQLLCDGLR